MSALLRQLLADAPTNLWLLDEPTGSTARDSVGTAHGTYRAGVTLGVKLGALPGVSLNGATAGVDLPTWGPAGNVSWTYEVWAMTTTAPTGATFFVASARNPGQYLGEAYLTTSGAYGHGTDDVQDMSIAFAAAVSNGALHQIVLQRQPTLAAVFFDAVQIATSGANGKAYAQGAGAIGYDRRGSSDSFIGKLSTVAFFPSFLSAARIKAHFDAGVRAGSSY